MTGALPAMAWRIATRVASPLLPLFLARRVRRGKEIAARLPERQGHGADRPPGRLVWLHAASVGESQSLLPLLTALARRAPDLHFLVTTGTVTSAALLAERLPPALAARTRHRFVPLDVPAWVARFLDTWRPDAGIFVESELWPNLIAAATARNIPLGLVNARLSKKATATWARLPGFAARVLGAFRLVAAQTHADADRLRQIGAAEVQSWGNLKAAAAPLPADPAELARLRTILAGRPVFVAASTHPGEEAAILAARPAGVLTILVPRHPDRGAEVAALAGAAPRRSLGATPGPADPVWVADTLGELGLWFRLAGAAFIGGSLVPLGGHNPLEAARLGCPVIFGPHMGNFSEAAALLLQAGGAIQVPDAAALAAEVAAVLTNARKAGDMVAAAMAAMGRPDGSEALPDRLAAVILPWLPPAEAAGVADAEPGASVAPG
ncbi:3-deoxy-D-manno-octulosonic acid transferase [Humitalea sp. 24SJ18S-53]|uniref:3-deoxy-D-manno-octulosonic acid transferase n=1 Tax=Humitalea sp. 24SJ18S-53 TaxID=3422307 RepID=UPI003D67624A